MPQTERTDINPKVYKCPKCGKECNGRRGLTLHVRSHFDTHQFKKYEKKDQSAEEMTKQELKYEFEIQKLIVDTVYGEARVNSVTNAFMDGKYTNKDLPINIRYYLFYLQALTGKKQKPPKDENPDEKKSTDNTNTDDEKDKEEELYTIQILVSELKELADENLTLCINKEDMYGYVSDARFNDSSDLLLKTSLDRSESLTTANMLKYLTSMMEELPEVEDATFEIKYKGDTVKSSSKKDEKYFILNI